MFFNEEEIHTVYAVEHNSETYIINTYGTDSYKQREKTFSDPSRIIILESNKRVTGWMEPLDEFLNAEQAMKSYVRLVKTEKKAKKFDPNQKSLFHKLANAKLAHCSQAIGKYLESQGILENRSAYSDFLYYIPDVVRKQLGIISDKLYQLI
jgi:predicted Zn-dependent protease